MRSESVAAPSLEVFQAGLGGARSGLGQWKEVELDELYGPFQPRPV